MKVLVHGISDRVDKLQVPAMNYGQLQRWSEHNKLPYSIELLCEELLNTCSKFFEQFREEELADDADEGFAELAEWKASGWPTLPEMLESHPALLEKLIVYSDLEILNILLKTASVESPFYIVNSLDEAIINEEKITISGICFEVKLA
ncbi:hypothetical protein [Roseivirga pacifica]|uniref:hypothetical protein n=1 Tax=Roseivirga pacifica TaxID=1267423 RepID=UPI0020945991|nr:hypothetical protein [Roseivirga pacifica]MCO6360860.1 hypothetical protein [Roseivirga pacifica]MCO6368749.1 hypothetical protein [Roseivirga pacifica]MCO6372892.1 hypothetical protein [Roseivirga pacifica]MCO6376951.1 hypothetical protein [Roseivirga pacifica]MCO6377771.1 hypothetical protein [Roseivirga pacifica]